MIEFSLEYSFIMFSILHHFLMGFWYKILHNSEVHCVIYCNNINDRLTAT